MNIRFVECLNEYFVNDGHMHVVEGYGAFSFSAYFLVHQLQQAEIVLVYWTAQILEFGHIFTILAKTDFVSANLIINNLSLISFDVALNGLKDAACGIEVNRICCNF